MANTSVPQRILGTRGERGLQLYRERGAEIEYVRGSLWSVPSCSGEGLYLADVGSGACTCPDMPPAGESCKHVHAATIARAKSSRCAGCGKVYRRRELVEAQESLTYFEGDLLCEECRNGSDAVVL
jgi:uncharacterized Zn finger protein